MSEDLGRLAATEALAGDRLLALGKVGDALAAYDRAVKRAPRQITYRYKRALAKARAGMLIEARTEMEVLVELEPDHAAYRIVLDHLLEQEHLAGAGARPTTGSAASTRAGAPAGAADAQPIASERHPSAGRDAVQPGDDPVSPVDREARPAVQRTLAQGSRARAHDGARPATGQPIVLVVDDDADITEAVAEHLHAEGWQVRRAHTMEEALLLGTQPPLPHAIVYDYYMGEITGLEVREEVAYHLAKAGIEEPPYIMLTARNNRVTEQYAAQRGAQAYVLKAQWLDPEAGLTAAVRRTLRRA